MLIVLTVMVEVPVPPDVSVIEAELRDAVGPVGVTVVDSVTAPESPDILVRVTVAVPVEPG